MSANKLPAIAKRELARAGFHQLPPMVIASGDHAARRFIEFFAVTIRNKNTRLAYTQAVLQFLAWCEERGIQSLQEVQPIAVAAYVENHKSSVPTIKQHLAAIRKLYDWLVTGQVIPHSPATSVRGPAHVVTTGKTPILSKDQARLLIDSIDISTIAGLRDRALIGVMVYSFARVSAVVTMQIQDYFQDRKRWKFRLHEKGGKRHAVPAHHNAEEYLDAYLDAAGIEADKKSLIFRTINKHGKLTSRGMSRTDALKMIKRHAKRAALPYSTCCHTFRGTGITAFLENGGTIENAQAIAAHASPRTTKLYDRTSDEITLDEIERITI